MSHRDRERRPGRRAPHRTPRRRLLVVCEGGRRTEPEYIRGFERAARNATVEVEIPNERGDPRRIVELAKRLSTEAAARAKREGDEFHRFDEVWCVFDRDEFERFDEACDMAKANGFRLAVSNPCIELWLLLHFRESPGARHRHELSGLLREHVPGFDKGVNFEDFRPGVERATARARRLEESAIEMGEPGRNPTTSFFYLTDSIARRDDRV